MKLQSDFIEITLRHGCSPVNLLHIFRTPFPKNASGGLLKFIVMCNYDGDPSKMYFRNLTLFKMTKVRRLATHVNIELWNLFNIYHFDPFMPITCYTYLAIFWPNDVETFIEVAPIIHENSDQKLFFVFYHLFVRFWAL